MEKPLHLAFRETLEEAQTISDNLSQLYQALYARLGQSDSYTARLGMLTPRQPDDLAFLQNATLQIEHASRYLSDLRSPLERLYSDLSGLEKQHSRLTTLYGISQTLNSTLDLEALLNVVMDRIISVMKAERGFLMLIDDQTRQLDFKVARNMSREIVDESSFQVSRSIVDRVVSERNPVLTTNAQSDPRFSAQASIIAYNLRSILCAPLIVKDELIGVIYVDNRIRAGLFGQNDLDLLVAFANQAAIAIENARLFESIVHNMNEIAKLKVQMDNIFASITSGVVTINDDGEVTTFNNAAENIFGVPAELAVGRPYQEVFKSLEYTVVPALIDRVVRDGRRYIGYEIRCDIGSQQDVILTISLSALKNAENQTSGAAMVIEDVTETRRLAAEKEVIKDAFQRVVARPVVERLLSSPPKLGGEKQVVTVLFADIRGYTAIAERVTPEELLNILNSYFALTTKAILNHEGTVDKFLGDGIMAIFNAPLSQPDHALRGVRAAFEMVRLLDDYHASPRTTATQLSIGIGINTGEAIAGNVGAPELMNYTVIGDAVNVARRLQENARPGQILLSSSTYELVKDLVSVQLLDPITVRGRSSPVPIYQLTGLTS